MVHCVVKGCPSYGGSNNLSYFRIPRHMMRRLEWMKRLNLEERPLEKLINLRVCSNHFISGKPSHHADENDPDWAPSLKLDLEVTHRRSKRSLIKTIKAIESGYFTPKKSKKSASATAKSQKLRPKSLTSRIRVCAVNSCPNNIRNVNKKGVPIHFHNFPDNPYFQQLWVNFCDVAVEIDANRAMMCSEHFSDECFFYETYFDRTDHPFSARMLKEDAVPTLFSPLDAESNRLSKKLKEVMTAYVLSKTKSQNRSIPGAHLLQPGNLKSPQNKLRKNVLLKNPHSSTSSSAEDTSEEESTAQEVPERLPKIVNIVSSDGSYHENNYTDVIPSTLCETVLKPQRKFIYRSHHTKRKLAKKLDETQPNSSSISPVFPNDVHCGIDQTGESTPNPQAALITVANLGTRTVTALPAIDSSDDNDWYPTPSSTEHPLETFFRSMGRTVLKFPPHLIAEAKIKVCQLVSEMEVRAIQEGFTQKMNPS